MNVVLVGVGVAAAAFMGRVGLQALRKYKAIPGATSGFGKQFYKGGFDSRMNRREASLILSLRRIFISNLATRTAADTATFVVGKNSKHKELYTLNHTPLLDIF
ncbi:hypothetical protein Dda_6463 [Drechslerella dactyloides]|uniref:Uncharacterized protein n=1 Tax=Drechslerella dactyloides TaxID=74499 RepID=A0AAD6ITJ0_DREDA|nr:hypothetical protein Dda_6463 [Drechslerella dactyloides]